MGLSFWIGSRLSQIWEALLVLADLARGSWPERARKASLEMVRSGHEEGAIAALLFDILVCFLRENRERVFSRTLTAELNAQGDRPWAELKRGSQATELWLARELRPYRVRPKTMWIGEEAAKGYLKEDFTEVFGRYVSAKEARVMRDEMTGPAEPPRNAGAEQ